MLSKLLQHANRFKAIRLLRVPVTSTLHVRKSYIPASQYDVPFPDKLKLGYAMSVYWEIIPLVISTVIGLGLTVMTILWSFRNKVDCVYTTHSRANISRIMDLNYPSIHKMITINQRYEAWPQMQAVLDKMKGAERRAKLRLESCGHP